MFQSRAPAGGQPGLVRAVDIPGVHTDQRRVVRLDAGADKSVAYTAGPANVWLISRGVQEAM